MRCCEVARRGDRLRAAGGTTNGPLIDGVRVEDISISCPGDVDGDGTVTGGDIGLVLLNFGDCPSN